MTIYNHTGKDVAALWPSGGEAMWRHDSILRLESGREQMKWVSRSEGDGVRVPVFSVRRGGRIMEYTLALRVPPEYVQTDAGTDSFFLQLEPDGGLYAVKAGSVFPVRDLSPQPAGFPIAP